MRHNKDHRKLNRTASHRKAMLRNMVTSLFSSERVTTTTAKAKEARRVADRMITFARRGDLPARRHVAKTVQNPKILKKLFDEIAPRYKSRPGGYTRIIKVGARVGDSAETAILELVGKDDKPRGKKKNSRKTYHKVEIPADPVAARRKEQAEVLKKKPAKKKVKGPKAGAEPEVPEELPDEKPGEESVEPEAGGESKPAE